MIMWLLEKSTLEKLESIQLNSMFPSDEQLEKFRAVSDGQSISVETSGVTAEIPINGLLTKSKSFFAIMLGLDGTTYPDIRAAIAEAESDSAVENIVLRFDSPGGEAGAELMETMSAIRNTKKPVTAVVGDMAASAAYGLAAQADRIIAQNAMSLTGSVGAMTTRYIDKKKVSIVSSNAPLKNPDASTDEGYAAIQKSVNEIAAVFVENIAQGRGITAEEVNANFGRGAVVLAADALQNGMIDSIANSGNKQTAENTAQTTKKESYSMDLAKLKAEHPDLYQAAVNEGVAAGEKAERDRVNAHLVLGKSSGDMETAIKAVENGDGLTATIQAKYMAAGMNKNDQQALANEDDHVDTSAKNTNKDEQEDKDAEDMAVASAVAELLGGE